MAELKTYQGRPIKRMKRTPAGIKLIFISPVPDIPGKQITITQSQWNLYGNRRILPKDQMPNLRELAAQLSD